MLPFPLLLGKNENEALKKGKLCNVIIYIEIIIIKAGKKDENGCN